MAREFSCSTILADILVGRQIISSEEIERFLEPRLSDLADPGRLPGIDAAVERIVRAKQSLETVAVFGDYDVDGLSSTALLVDFFRFLEFPVRPSIPNRLEDGYGLSAAAVRRLAADGVNLIITVDNGSTAVEAVEEAGAHGLDVVVVDHHLPGTRLPRAVAIVNPWLPDSEYPFPQLAGVGVTFKLIWAICQRFSRSRKVSRGFRDFMMSALGYVALGTIADVVPLVGENRILTRFGLRALETNRRAGLAALVRMALQGAYRSRPLTAEDVAFRIAPCLNAAGRLGEPEAALDLLLCQEAGEASRMVRHLVRENQRRREIERAIYAEARERVLREVDLGGERCVVLAGERWHPGVIGIVAARVVEEFFRPALLISLQDGQGKGSARSIPQVSICDALAKASDCLEGFGGHAQAAGVRIQASKVEELRRRLNAAVDVAPADMIRQLEIDGEYDLGAWTPDVMADLERLAPFGEGNREPLFAARGITVAGVPRVLGRDSSHLSFFVKNGTSALRAIAFGMADWHPRLTGSSAAVSMVYQPVVNRFGGRQQIELRVRELRADATD